MPSANESGLDAGRRLLEYRAENRLLRMLLAAGGARTWIWGTGQGGRAALAWLRELGIAPAGFLDGGAVQPGRSLAGIPVHSASEAPAAHASDALVIVASVHADEIFARIREEGTWRGTMVVWDQDGAGAGAVGADAPGLTASRDELSALVQYAAESAIQSWFSSPPVHPRQVNYARLAWLAAATEAAAYMTEHMQGAVDLESAAALRAHAFAQSTGDGLILEFGVGPGHSLRQLASLTTQDVHGFDSFEGLPEDWTYFQKKGRFSRGGQFPAFEATNVRLHRGWFDDTLPAFLRDQASSSVPASSSIPSSVPSSDSWSDSSPVSSSTSSSDSSSVRFLHIDCDLYRSTLTVLEMLRDRILPGTIIVFDEYLNYPGWRQHEYKAFQEIVERTGLRYRYLGFASSEYSVAVEIL